MEWLQLNSDGRTNARQAFLEQWHTAVQNEDEIETAHLHQTEVEIVQRSSTDPGLFVADQIACDSIGDHDHNANPIQTFITTTSIAITRSSSETV